MAEVVERATSGRASCKACGCKIELRALRMGEERQGEWCAALQRAARSAHSAAPQR
jgi:hypothetical protein